MPTFSHQTFPRPASRIDLRPGISSLPADAAQIPTMGIFEWQRVPVEWPDGKTETLYRAAPMFESWIRLIEAEKLPLALSKEVMLRLIRGGFVEGGRAAPASSCINVRSLLEHIDETRSNLDWWQEGDRRLRYHLAGVPEGNVLWTGVPHHLTTPSVPETMSAEVQQSLPSPLSSERVLPAARKRAVRAGTEVGPGAFFLLPEIRTVPALGVFQWEPVQVQAGHGIETLYRPRIVVFEAWLRLCEAEELFNIDKEVLVRLVTGGFVEGTNAGPSNAAINPVSLLQHLDTVKRDPQFWRCDERKQRYDIGIGGGVGKN